MPSQCTYDLFQIKSYNYDSGELYIYIGNYVLIFLLQTQKKANYLLVPEGLVNNSVNQNFH